MQSSSPAKGAPSGRDSTSAKGLAPLRSPGRDSTSAKSPSRRSGAGHARQGSAGGGGGGLKNPFKKKPKPNVFCPICDGRFDVDGDVMAHLAAEHGVDMHAGEAPDEEAPVFVPPARANSRLLRDLVHETEGQAIEDEWVLLDSNRERVVQAPKGRRAPLSVAVTSPDDARLWEQLMVDVTSKQWRRDVLPLLRRGVPAEMVRRRFFLFFFLSRHTHTH